MLGVNAEYITIECFREEFPDITDALLPDAELSSLIIKAQFIIDKEIGCFGEKAEEDQCFIFPIKDGCNDPVMPKQIQLATLLLVKQLYEESVDSGTDISDDCNDCGTCDNQKIKKISIGEVTTEFYAEGCNDQESNTLGYDWKSFLSKFKSSVFTADKKIDFNCNTKCGCDANYACRTCA